MFEPSELRFARLGSFALLVALSLMPIGCGGSSSDTSNGDGGEDAGSTSDGSFAGEGSTGQDSGGSLDAARDGTRDLDTGTDAMGAHDSGGLFLPDGALAGDGCEPIPCPPGFTGSFHNGCGQTAICSSN
jgi:hypothetical protein